VTQADHAQMLSGNTSHRLIKPGGKGQCWNYNMTLRRIPLRLPHDYHHPQCCNLVDYQTAAEE
jgi:hypothetical protein